MRLLCHWIAAAVLLASAAWVRAAEAPSPDDVVNRYYDATKTGDWKLCASLMNEDGLKKLRTAMRPVVAKSPELAQKTFGVDTVADYDKLSLPDFYERFMHFVLNSSPGLDEILKTMTVKTVSTEAVGDDEKDFTVHITVKVKDQSVTQPEIVKAKRGADGWRVMLREQELQGAEQMVKALMQ